MDEARLVLRGLSLRLLKTYLLKLGAHPAGEDRFIGAGWTARLSARQVQVGKISLEEVEVQFTGEPGPIRQALAQLRLKALRGGG